jgi:succinate-semialdehyde dehydrogenase / glutarate-semialdehyde dehydrogenase
MQKFTKKNFAKTPRGNFAFSEEIFGPVFSIVPCKDETQAIAYHNATDYGLGGAVFSGASESEVNRATSIAENDLTTGMCFVNDFVRSDASMPFGGKDLDSHYSANWSN